MNIKKNIWALAAALLFTTAFTNCSDWTEVEAEKKVDYGNTETSRPESYYQALREWKKTDHSISFGWFSDWGDPAVSTANMLAGLPDSMDMVSLWGAWSNLPEGKKADLKYVQEKKGTKVVFCSFTEYVGQGFTPEEYNTDEETRNAFWGWVEVQKLDEEGNPVFDKQGNPVMVPEEGAMKASLKKYAHAILDTMYKYNYDGFDIDFEPNYGGGGPLSSYNDRMHILIEELGKQIGPMSPNPEKLLLVDGEPQTLNAETGPYISYYVVQAYAGTSGNPASWMNSFGNLDRRLQLGIDKFAETVGEEEVTNRYVMTENLEPALEALQGGYRFYDRSNVLMDYPSLVGMARWQPLNGFRKGGFGAYRFSNEGINKPSYKWMRTGIQAQNPAVN